METPADAFILREREGRCGSCGIDTHEIVTTLNGREAKKGLTIDGLVLHGRCLLCHPVSVSARASALPSRPDSTTSASIVTPVEPLPDETPSDAWVYDVETDNEMQGTGADDEDPMQENCNGQKSISGQGGDSNFYSSRTSLQMKRRIETSSSEHTASKKSKTCAEGSTDSKTQEKGEGNAQPGDSDDRQPFKKAIESQRVLTPKKSKIKSSRRSSDFKHIQDIVTNAMARMSLHKYQENSIEKLRCIAESKSAEKLFEWADAVAESGGIDMILNAMRKHNKKTYVLFEGCKTLSLLAWAGEEARIVSSGGIAAILRAMKCCGMRSPRLLEASFEALVNLSASSELVAQFISEGGPEKVAMIISRMPHTAGLQLQASKLLANLASDDHVSVANEFSKLGVVPVLVKAFEGSENGDLLEAVCTAFANLARTKVARKEIIESGGIEKILGILTSEDLTSNESLQESALSAMNNLALDKKYSALVVRAGGIVLVIKAMQRHQDCVEIQRKGFAVLGKLHLVSKASAALTSEVILTGLQKHPVPLRQEALPLLHGLCKYPSVAKHLSKSRSQQTLRLLAHYFSDSHRIVDDINKSIL